MAFLKHMYKNLIQLKNYFDNIASCSTTITVLATVLAWLFNTLFLSLGDSGPGIESLMIWIPSRPNLIDDYDTNLFPRRRSSQGLQF